MGKYSIGIDFGTESGRVVVLDVTNGDIVATHVTPYRHQVITDYLIDNKSIPLKRDTALQHPQDYLNVLEQSIPASLQAGNIKPEEVIGIGIDFTACTILPVTRSLTPLCFDEKFKDNPHAYVKLWKHHAAQNQADRINQLAKKRNEPWLKRYGGIISSEWLLPKVLEVLEEAPEVYEETTYFIEAADWITSFITGNLKRNSCAAGFKGMWNDTDGYVSKEFLKALHPKLESIYENKLSGEVAPVGNKAGALTRNVAKRIGLKEGTSVAMGIIDAHAAVPGASVTDPGTMVLVIGTSTCHMVLSEQEHFVEGISGVVKDSIIPNYYAYEAGQAAVGDIFAWFVNENIPSYIHQLANQSGLSVHEYLEQEARQIPPGSNGLIAIDWHNGSRTPFVNADLSGAFIGLTLHTKPTEMYRSLIEATAYGTRRIIEQFNQQGMEIKKLVACGGIPQKNELFMQIYADVTGMPIKVAENTLTSGVGAAMYGAVVADVSQGGYQSITEAAEKMAKLKDFVYTPNKNNHQKYNQIYEHYKELTDYFGNINLQLMEDLKQIR